MANAVVESQTKKETKVEVEINDIDLVENRFKEQEGKRRKIIHLWGKYYRINYHDTLKSNYIVESHFVHVSEDKQVKEGI